MVANHLILLLIYVTSTLAVLLHSIQISTHVVCCLKVGRRSRLFLVGVDACLFLVLVVSMENVCSFGLVVETECGLFIYHGFEIYNNM